MAFCDSLIANGASWQSVEVPFRPFRDYRIEELPVDMTLGLPTGRSASEMMDSRYFSSIVGDAWKDSMAFLMMKRLARLGGMTLLLLTCARFAAAEERRMVAAFAQTAPVIDGKRTSESEWHLSSPMQSDWAVLDSEDGSDSSNNRWTAVWDNQGLFLLHEVEYDGWSENGVAGINFGYENLQFFFDPNTDGETNAQDGPNDTGVDGYQLVVNQPHGESGISPFSSSAGMYREAHTNSENGDHGQPWSNFRDLRLQQTTSVEEGFGFTELFIPWSNFDATNPAFGFSPEFGDDIGLYHPQAPIDGEEWFFNIGRVQSDAQVISWAVSEGASRLSARPHGVIQFLESGVTEPCDVNEDGACNEVDIDLVSTAVREMSNIERYDLDENGSIDDEDRKRWVLDGDMMFTWFGDANLDGEFNSSDFVTVFTKGEYEDGIPNNSGWAEGDWNGDGDFTTSDFVLAFMLDGYERGPRGGAASIVPEPSSWTLILISFLGLVRRRLSVGG